MNDYTIFKTPKYVGGYYLGGKQGFGVLLEHKPNIFHRFMMKFGFGWEWINEKK